MSRGQDPVFRVGSLSFLDQRRPRQGAVPIALTAFGFCVGSTFVPWQAVSTIHACRLDNDDALLEFAAHGQCLPIRAAQPGFAALAAAMRGVFPETAGWREALRAAAPPCGRTLLYRRP